MFLRDWVLQRSIEDLLVSYMKSPPLLLPSPAKQCCNTFLSSLPTPGIASFIATYVIRVTPINISFITDFYLCNLKNYHNGQFDFKTNNNNSFYHNKHKFPFSNFRFLIILKFNEKFVNSFQRGHIKRLMHLLWILNFVLRQVFLSPWEGAYKLPLCLAFRFFFHHELEIREHWYYP